MITVLLTQLMIKCEMLNVYSIAYTTDDQM